MILEYNNTKNDNRETENMTLFECAFEMEEMLQQTPRSDISLNQIFGCIKEQLDGGELVLNDRYELEWKSESILNEKCG